MEVICPIRLLIQLLIQLLQTKKNREITGKKTLKKTTEHKLSLLTIKNTASEAKSFVRVEANIYDNNDVFVCHGFDVGTTLQPRQNSNFFILCQGAYAADKSLKEPEIKILEKYT